MRFGDHVDHLALPSLHTNTFLETNMRYLWTADSNLFVNSVIQYGVDDGLTMG